MSKSFGRVHNLQGVPEGTLISCCIMSEHTSNGSTTWPLLKLWDHYVKEVVETIMTDLLFKQKKSELLFGYCDTLGSGSLHLFIDLPPSRDQPV